MSRQHLSWRHLSISRISQLLFSWFWPKFKSRFLGPSWPYSSCRGDICPDNICPDNICPYQQYLISAVNTHHPPKLNVRNISAVTVPEVYQTLRVGPWDHLEHIIAKKNVAKKKFAEKKIWRKKKFRQNFFAHKQFLTRNFFSPKFFFCHFFLPNKIFLPNFFLPNKFFH